MDNFLDSENIPFILKMPVMLLLVILFVLVFFLIAVPIRLFIPTVIVKRTKWLHWTLESYEIPKDE